MNNFLCDKNKSIFNITYQKLDSHFPNDYDDSEIDIEKNYSILDKNKILNKNITEYDVHKYKNIFDYKSINLDNFLEVNTPFITTNDNNISDLKQDLLFFLNKENNNNNSFIKKKIFRIEKMNKKIGRIKKNSNIKGIHNNLSEDNIIRKIKGRFTEKLRKYINEEYKKYLFQKTNKKKKAINFLKKIDPKISRKIKKEENIKWFESKIYEIFSEKISLRYSTNSPDSNKKRINNIMTLNKAKNLIDILNTKVGEYFDKYINDEQIEGFKTLRDDIKELESFMENNNQDNIKEYITKYEYVAKNMKKIFNRKISRNFYKHKVEK